MGYQSGERRGNLPDAVAGRFGQTTGIACRPHLLVRSIAGVPPRQGTSRVRSFIYDPHDRRLLTSKRAVDILNLFIVNHGRIERFREGTTLRQIGILFQSHLEEATRLADALDERARLLGKKVWRRSSWDEGLAEQDVSETDLIISVGGDGTLLRVTRVAAPWGIPILGVNAGRLGFLTEIEGAEALTALPEIIEGRGWMEERTMLLVQKDGAPYYAMNEAVLSRGAPARVVQVTVRVDDSLLTTFRGDGLIVATATGSTGYNLAAGGPVLPPEAPYMIVKPVSSHPVSGAPLLIDPSVHLHITVRTDHGAALSIDGQDDYKVADGDEITVRRSPYQACFLHLRPPGYFYEMLQGMLSGTRRHPDLPDQRDDDGGFFADRHLPGEPQEARR